MNRILLGFSNNIDHEIFWNQDFFNELILRYEICYEDINGLGEIQSIRDLLITILFCVKNNIGLEYHVNNFTTLYEFSSLFKYKITHGGTAIRAGIALNIMNKSCAVYLSSYSQDIVNLLPSKIHYLNCSKYTESYPHIIIQYPENTTFNLSGKKIFSPKAERIIFVNDAINENILIDQNITDSYFPFKVLLISGLNTIKCDSLIKKNLNNLNNIIRKSSDKTFTFYEHAGYHNLRIERLVRDFIFPKVNFFSMNEHEFAGIIESYEFIENPEFLVNSLISLRTRYEFDKILIHTSRWSLLFGNESAKFKDCLQNAINISSARMVFGDYLNFTDYSNVGNSLEIENKSLEFSKYFNCIGESDFCCLPSYKITSENPTTIGLGDFFVAGFISSLSEVEYILS